MGGNTCSVVIFLFLFVSIYAEFEERPTYGYHSKIGISKAWMLRARETQRIVGGNPVNTADAVPYQAGIITTLTNSWTSICGGSIISHTRILTAAHCWWDGESQARLFTIVLGSLTIFNGGTRIDTANVKVHPEWKVNMIHDIAIAVIPQVNFNNNIQVIPLPTTAEVNLDFAGALGYISGYGKTSDSQTSFPASTSLHQTTVAIITNAVCQRSFSIPIHGSHVCVSGQDQRGTCEGDSGGPLAVVHNTRRILIGVVSFGPSEGCQASLPSVFTRVTAYLTWIQSSM